MAYDFNSVYQPPPRTYYGQAQQQRGPYADNVQRQYDGYGRDYNQDYGQGHFQDYNQGYRQQQYAQSQYNQPAHQYQHPPQPDYRGE